MGRMHPSASENYQNPKKEAPQIWLGALDHLRERFSPRHLPPSALPRLSLASDLRHPSLPLALLEPASPSPVPGLWASLDALNLFFHCTAWSLLLASRRTFLSAPALAASSHRVPFAALVKIGSSVCECLLLL
ncbi:hypothetical protein ACLOJK_003722 [Asimina triloba]